MSLMMIDRNKIMQTLAKIEWIKCSCKGAITFKKFALTNDQKSVKQASIFKMYSYSLVLCLFDFEKQNNIQNETKTISL